MGERPDANMTPPTSANVLFAPTTTYATYIAYQACHVRSFFAKFVDNGILTTSLVEVQSFTFVNERV